MRRKIISPTAQRLNQNQKNSSSSSETITKSLDKLIDQFLAKVENEEIRLEKVSDLQRLVEIYTAAKEIGNMEADKAKAEESRIKGKLDMDNPEVENLYRQIMQSYNEQHDEMNRVN